MSRQPDQYVFTFGADGAVTSVAEVEKNGRLDYEKIEKGESYRLIDGFVVKTEIDGREQEWTIFGDGDADGRWVELAEGDGPFDPGILAGFGAGTTPTPTPGDGEPTSPVAVYDDDSYVFTFDAAGRVSGVFEVERNGRLEREDIDRDESYVLFDGSVIKTEWDDGRLEMTVYSDMDGDGVWTAQPPVQITYAGLW
ncbi:MAG: hypothetical protein U1C74_21520 [Phenylobacterium sp.]|nr:hypothetical protein [Phenylobacterium sp.]